MYFGCYSLRQVFSLWPKTKKKAMLTAIIPILFVIISWVSYFYDTPFISITGFILTLCTLFLLSVLVLVKVFESGPITGYRIAGSIVVYMLLATIWAEVYLYLYSNIEGAFQLTLPEFKSNSIQANFMYFSYITITTTGYGEVLPLHPVARALVQLEVLTGVLYPVILIGRLVSDAGSIRKQ